MTKKRFGGIRLNACRKQTTKIRGVLFDKDGTLIDFNAIWMPLAFELASKFAAAGPAQSIRKNRAALLKEIGVNLDGSMSPSSIYASGTMRDIADALYSAAGRLQITLPDKAQFSEVIKENTNSYMAANGNRIRPIDGVACTLDALKQLGLFVGVSTSDSRTNTQLCLEEAGLLQYFDYIGCADTVSSPKPSGDLLMDFCCKFNIQPGEVAIVGDTLTDMEFAKQNNAGLAIGVLSGTCDENTLASRADVILDSVAEIVKYGVPVWKSVQLPVTS